MLWYIGIAVLPLAGCTSTRFAAGDVKVEPNLQAMSLCGGTALGLAKMPWLTVGMVTFPEPIGRGITGMTNWVAKPTVKP